MSNKTRKACKRLWFKNPKKKKHLIIASQSSVRSYSRDRVYVAGDCNLHLQVVTSKHDKELTRLVEPFVYGWTSKFGGSVSAEHGIGLMKINYLGHTKSAQAINLMRSLKNTMDPKHILNPYKIIPAVVT